VTRIRTSGSAPPATSASARCRATLQRLAEADDSSASSGHEVGAVDREGLDERTAAVALLAASVALRATHSSYRRSIERALAAGASVDDVVGTLKVVARTVGLARVVAAAPGLALAAGYDIDDALETLDDPRATGPDSRGLAELT
jgi:alkylhydroperoxidase/carboxymuconolactone decarboxylase family protein YurZ